MCVPNFSSLAGLDVDRLITSGSLGKANQIRLIRLGYLGHLNRVGPVRVCAKFQLSRWSTSGLAN